MKFAVISVPLAAISLTLSACGGGESDTAGDTGGGEAAAGAETGEISAERGATVFLRCRACHMVEKDASHTAGPNLHGLFGATAGTKEGFTYSAAMQESGIVWNAETLDGYLKKPLDYIKGGRMAFAGIPDDAERTSLIKYLEENTK